MLKMSARNCIWTLSPMAVFFMKLMSVLLIPGPQQMVLGALPMVPGATVEFVKELGSNTNPPVCRILVFTRCGCPAAKFGSPAASKRKVLSSCSISSCEVIRIGKPDWKLKMPDSSQPSSHRPLNPSIFGTGKSHTKLKTKRWGASKADGPYVARKSSGFRLLSKLEALSSDLPKVYAAWNISP